jgi:nucleoside-diphosphate-sugar epimerase
VDVPLLVADISHLRVHTGWKPQIDLKDALEQTLNFWREVITDPVLEQSVS